MKIAVCFSGLGEGKEDVLRGWETIKEYVYHSEHEYDTYFHAWLETKEIEQSLVETLQPKEYLVEPHKDQIDQSVISSTISTPYRLMSVKETIPHRILNQMLSRKKVTQLVWETAIKEEIAYDLVVVLRYDICFKTYVEYTDMKINTVYWSGHSRKRNKVFDYFWLGSPDLIHLTMGFMYDSVKREILDMLMYTLPAWQSRGAVPVPGGFRKGQMHELYDLMIEDLRSKFVWSRPGYEDTLIDFQPILEFRDDYHLCREAVHLTEWSCVLGTREVGPSRR